MIIEFRLNLDGVDSFETPDYEPIEYITFLNQAMLRVVDDFYEQYETSQKARDSVRSIVKHKEVTTINVDGVYNGFNKYTFLDSELTHYRHHLRSSSLHGNRYRKNIFIGQSSFDTVLEDPFNQPNQNKNLLFSQDKKFLIVSCESTLDKVNVTFMKTPVSIKAVEVNGEDQACELPAEVHIRVVEEAVKIVLESIKSQRYQTKSQEIFNSYQQQQ